MEFGIIEDISLELEELLLLTSNFYVYYDVKGKHWALCKYRFDQEFNGCGPHLPQKIAEFGSVGELFLCLLRSNEGEYSLFSSERDALIDCINFVFFMQDSSGQYDSKLRYHWYMQFQKQRRIHDSDFRIASCFLKEKARAMGLPDPKDASDFIRLAQKTGYFTEGNGIKEFRSCEDLAWWALDDIVWHNKQIARCMVCGQYFIKSKQYRKYCGTDCASKGKKTGAYLDDPKIKRLSDIINLRFTRKRKSNSLYLYNEATYGKDFNELDLFSDMEEKTIREDPTVGIFDSTHFEQMWKTYSGLRKDRYNNVRKAKKEYLSGKISEKQYKMLLDSFVSWLENVVKQLGAFSLYSARRGSY